MAVPRSRLWAPKGMGIILIIAVGPAGSLIQTYLRVGCSRSW